jgi:hypothetical protein
MIPAKKNNGNYPKEQYLPSTLLSLVTKRVEVLYCILFQQTI